MQALTSIEAAVIERCGEAPMLDQVIAWASINSGSRNLDGLDQLSRLLAEAFSPLPGILDLREATPVETMAADGSLHPVEHGANLHIRVRPEAPVQLLFTGHMDTVFGAEHPFQEVSWLQDGVLGGPGVADMKGGLAVLLAALQAVETSPAAARFGYELVINSDEEVGSPGSAALIAEAARGKHAAFTYEPAALPDGTLAAARPGSGNFSLFVRGRSAHAGRNPEEGRNAIVAAADLALRLDEAKEAGLKVNPARIEGGGPNNVVPDRAVLRVNLRPSTPADEAHARALIDEIARIVVAERDVEIQVHGGFGRPPKPVDERTGRLLELVSRCGSDLGHPVGWLDTGGVCDGNNIAACGIPVVDTMGVCGGAIHSEEEYLLVRSLVDRARLSALAILRLAEGGAP